MVVICGSHSQYVGLHSRDPFFNFCCCCGILLKTWALILPAIFVLSTHEQHRLEVTSISRENQEVGLLGNPSQREDR